MPPRIPLCARGNLALRESFLPSTNALRLLTTTATTSATTSYHPTQPPSFRRPDARRSQLLRQYVAILRSSPLMLIFQHSCVKANEFKAVRRELREALRRVDEAHGTNLADYIRLQVIRTGIMDVALRITQFHDPVVAAAADAAADAPQFTHALSVAAREAVTQTRRKHGFERLMEGPVGVLTAPHLSTDHLRVVLSLLFPSKEFPAPKRRANPGYHDPEVQAAIPKLMLLAARIEGRPMDADAVRWVGGMQGGLDGLRTQLVAMLQGAGVGLVSTLEGAGRSLYLTMEGRRAMLEEKPEDNSPA
jgi:large subunit ribosomal protein L10